MPMHASLRSSCFPALLLLAITGCGPVEGVCQFTGSCGTSRQYSNCGLDCGPCR
jgi:hypothetical protein